MEGAGSTRRRTPLVGAQGAESKPGHPGPREGTGTVVSGQTLPWGEVASFLLCSSGSSVALGCGPVESHDAESQDAAFSSWPFSECMVFRTFVCNVDQ